MPRKTIEVEHVKQYVNGFCAAKGGSRDARQAVTTVFESILFATGNYRGFRYLSQDELSEFDVPGIKTDYDGSNSNFVDTDGTRVYYF